MGETRYYGFAFKLGKDWKFEETWITIAQFISNFKNWKCPKHKKEWTPTTMVWIRGNKLFTRVRYGSICENRQQTIFKLGKVVPGKWHTLVLGVSWEKLNKGFFQAWFDGSLIVDLKNIATTVDIDKRYFQFRVGI